MPNQFIEYTKSQFMSPLERKIGRSKTIHSLPNYSAAGSYCFFSQCIELNNVEERDFLAAIDLSKSVDENYEALLKFAPLLNHEVKHWYDAHSTLWGLKLLRNIYLRKNDLYEAEQVGIGAQLPHFHKQIELRDSIEYIKFPDYYLTRNPKANTVQPWKYDYSAGIMFSKYGKPTDRNIFFTRFENAKGELIARAPFSLCALLEASAVAQELNTKVRIISLLEDPITYKIESDKLLKNTLDELYDENLVEYSVVAHKIANSFEIKDVIEAYNIAARVTRLILNLTDDVINLLNPETLLSEKFTLFFEPYKSAIKYKDYGAIFSLIIDSLFCKYQSQGIQVSNDNLKDLLGGLFLQEIGLSLSDIFSKSKDAVCQTCLSVDFKLEKEHIGKYLTLGKSFHDRFGLIGSHFINLDNELIPEFILGDDTFVSQQGGDQESFEKRYSELTDYYDYLSAFEKACIV